MLTTILATLTFALLMIVPVLAYRRETRLRREARLARYAAEARRGTHGV